MLQGLIAAIAQAIGENTNRFLLDRKRVGWAKFLVISFGFFALVLLPLLPFFSDFNGQAFTLLNIFFLFLLLLLDKVYLGILD